MLTVLAKEFKLILKKKTKQQRLLELHYPLSNEFHQWQIIFNTRPRV